MTKPLPVSFCFVHIVMKVVGKSMMLLLLDAILVTKYVLIFWLKNPGAVNDEFWCAFINIWVAVASVVYDTARFLLPGKQTFSYFTCAGKLIGPHFGSHFGASLTSALLQAVHLG